VRAIFKLLAQCPLRNRSPLRQVGSSKVALQETGLNDATGAQ
jgi:hypothetical protein